MRRRLLLLLLATTVSVLAPAGPAPAAPSANFTYAPTDPVTGQAVAFSASGRLCRTVLQRCTWSFGDGAVGEGPVLTHVYAVPGDFPVVLTVQDLTGSDSRERTVSVDGPALPPPDPPPPPPPDPDAPAAPGNQAPTVAFNYVTSGLWAAFASATSDADGDAVAVTWDFGDGATSTQADPVHAYARGGTYRVRVTATDPRGASRTASADVVVQRPADPAAPPTTQGSSTSAAAPVVPPIAQLPTAAEVMRRISPFPVVRVAGRFAGRSTRLTLLAIRAPRTARITVRCTGTGCPFTKRRYRPAGSSRSRTVDRLRGRLLRPGVVLDVRVTQPDRIGKLTRLRFRARQAPARRDGCVTPAGRSRRCPS